MEITRKRKYEKLSAVLFLAGFIINWLISYYMQVKSIGKHPLQSTPTLQIAILSTVFFLIAVYVWKGKQWAKVIMLLLLAGGFIVAFLTAVLRGVLIPALAHNAIQWTIAVANAVLLIVSFRRTRATPSSLP